MREDSRVCLGAPDGNVHRVRNRTRAEKQSSIPHRISAQWADIDGVAAALANGCWDYPDLPGFFFPSLGRTLYLPAVHLAPAAERHCSVGPRLRTDICDGLGIRGNGGSDQAGAPIQTCRSIRGRLRERDGEKEESDTRRGNGRRAQLGPSPHGRPLMAT